MSSGPYQSRLFNLLSRQTRNLKDRTGRALRQIQVGAVWGTQILLYPIYALFQSARLVGRQFKQTVQQVLPRLQAAEEAKKVINQPRSSVSLTADTPIRKTLQAVRSLALPVPVDIAGAIAPTPALESALTPIALHLPASNDALAVTEPGQLNLTKPEGAITTTDNLNASFIQASDSIRGVATLLENRSIVLVTTQNHVLDILTAEQQSVLRQRMAWEIAGYLRYQRVLQMTRQPSLQFLPPPADRKNALPPIRVFRQLMAWEQRGPVAIAVNLFQESALVLYTSVSSSLVDPQTTDSQERLIQANESLALPQRWDAWVAAYNNARSIATSLPSEQPLKRIPSVPNPITFLSKHLKSLPARRVSTESSPQIVPSSPLIQVEPEPMQPVAFKEPLLELKELPIEPLNPASSISADVTSSLIETQAKDGSQAVKTEQSGAIDIEATLVGYVKHPLEQILEWLDLGMLWIEQRVSQLVRWIRRWHV